MIVGHETIDLARQARRLARKLTAFPGAAAFSAGRAPSSPTGMHALWAVRNRIGASWLGANDGNSGQ